ncbi:hypothetical protein AGMMS50212_16510 [Spirochaetia bacterium]|nr:hypothetical protein AGMMS50212_16510 [Spirochaetia bacterium]
MDGISASKIIRERESEYAKKVPIVALSANALVGNKEMFLQNGIDDFLPKPIEIKRLDDILLKWIPSEKHVKTLGAAKSAEAETDTIPKINGLDTALGLIQTGLSVKAYKHILSVFRKDSEERITQIGRAFAAGNIKDYTLFAHAIKSVSLSLGALEVGNLAAKLEIAGNAGDELLIQDKTEEFLAMLRTLNKNIDEALCQDSVGNGEKKESVGFSAMNLEDLRKALCDMNIRELNKMLIEYKEMPLDNKARELANEIESDVLVFEYEKAVERIDNLK